MIRNDGLTPWCLVICSLLLLFLFFYQHVWKFPKMTNYSSFGLNSLQECRMISILCPIEPKKAITMRLCDFSFTTLWEYASNWILRKRFLNKLTLNFAIILHDIDTIFTAAHRYSSSVNNISIQLPYDWQKCHPIGVMIYLSIYIYYDIFCCSCSNVIERR